MYECSYLTGPVKCNRPSVTIWSVFQIPVTYMCIHNIIKYLAYVYADCRKTCIGKLRDSMFKVPGNSRMVSVDMHI